jgi:alkanesulfonate monooxygenase SsuD/methylene tetrahydromethanopterin reductase-like flavin-dependent oxidoreductase (luciferase family)
VPDGRRLILGIEVDGEGSHPAAWRRAAHPPADLLDPRRLVRVAERAERAGFAYVTLDDDIVPPGPDPGVVGRIGSIERAAYAGPPDGRAHRVGRRRHRFGGRGPRLGPAGRHRPGGAAPRGGRRGRGGPGAVGLLGALPSEEPNPPDDSGAFGSARFNDAQDIVARWRAAAGENGWSLRETVIRMGRRAGGHVGTPAGLADKFARFVREGAVDGFNVSPYIVPHGLDDIVELLVPALQERGAYPAQYAGTTLREHLGLRPGSSGREA